MSFFLADVVSQNCLVLKAKQEFIHLPIAIPTYRKGSSFKIYYNVCNLLYHEKGTCHRVCKITLAVYYECLVESEYKNMQIIYIQLYNLFLFVSEQMNK